MILIDTSVWVAVYRDETRAVARQLGAQVGHEPVATADVITCEVLQGTTNEAEWSQVLDAMSALVQLPIRRADWLEGARIFFDLQRQGITVRSTLDCCIASVAISNGARLLHIDRDFESIATVRRLDQLRFGHTP